MPVLSKSQLLAKIVEAIHESGWNVLFVSQNHPYKLVMFNDRVRYSLNIYIWNLSHGGGFMRPEDEYRIQVKVHEIALELDSKNLLLGWWDDGQVFAGFDIRKHLDPKWSASIQIKMSALQNAYESGFATSDKGNGEIAIAFRKDFFAEYVLHLEELHEFGSYSEDLAVLDKVAVNPQIDEAEIAISDNARRTIVTEVRRKMRDMSFQRRVLAAYDSRCAFCGVQLKLVDAAHIVPVSDIRSSDETHNGIALCALHHRAFDRSMVTLVEDYRIILNEQVISNLRSDRLIDGLDVFQQNLREVIILPAETDLRPHKQYITIANEIRGWEI